jgi:hypothetical protein
MVGWLVGSDQRFFGETFLNRRRSGLLNCRVCAIGLLRLARMECEESPTNKRSRGQSHGTSLGKSLPFKLRGDKKVIKRIFVFGKIQYKNKV